MMRKCIEPGDTREGQSRQSTQVKGTFDFGMAMKIFCRNDIIDTSGCPNQNVLGLDLVMLVQVLIN